MVDTSRRALLAAAATIPALSVPALAAQGTATHDAGLLRCIAAWRHAKNVCDAWHETVFNPAYAAFDTATKAVPHYTTKGTWEAYDGRQLHMVTTCETTRHHIETQRRRPNGFGDDDYGQCCKELASALDERNAKRAQLDADWQATGLNKHSDRLGDLRFEKYVAIEDYPVRTLADLILKIETMHSIEDDPYDSEKLLADLNRIAGRA